MPTPGDRDDCFKRPDPNWNALKTILKGNLLGRDLLHATPTNTQMEIGSLILPPITITHTLYRSRF